MQPLVEIGCRRPEDFIDKVVCEQEMLKSAGGRNVSYRLSRAHRRKGNKRKKAPHRARDYRPACDIVG